MCSYLVLFLSKEYPGEEKQPRFTPKNTPLKHIQTLWIWICVQQLVPAERFDNSAFVPFRFTGVLIAHSHRIPLTLRKKLTGLQEDKGGGDVTKLTGPIALVSDYNI